MAAIIDYRGKSPVKAAFGIPLITAKIVKNGRILAPDEFIAPEEYDEWMRRGLPQPGDVLMTTEAPLGEIAQLDGTKVALAQRLITLRGKKGVLDNKFLKFLMQSWFVQRELKARATGTTVLGIRQSELRKVRLPIPPVEEQRAIAEVLGALDDKIELNRRMNEMLEAMARTIFKSWFVDFDPTRAKGEGRQPAGMDSATAALFPSSFEDSALGKIPKGWTICRLEKVAGINQHSVSKDFSQTEIEYVEISSVTEGRLKETTRYLLSEAPSRARRLTADGDTIWSCVRPNRRSYLYVCKPPENLVVSTGFAVLTPKEIPAAYLYEWVTRNEFVEYLAYSADGSAYPAVRPERFATADVLVPPPVITGVFQGLVGPMREKIASSERESVTLAHIRDTLLPKLLSGEVRLGTKVRAAGGSQEGR